MPGLIDGGNDNEWQNYKVSSIGLLSFPQPRALHILPTMMKKSYWRLSDAFDPMEH